MMPKSVVLDPRATVHTPEWLFLSTGIRAVDHAVEDICSPQCQPISEGASYHALRLLGRGLLGVKADPLDLEARLDCQLGAWMSMIGSQTGVPKGASHGIGHVLGGTAHVPHGYTSCVMLPHVLRFNAPVNADRQALVSEALGRPGEPAAEVVAALIAGLGLPDAAARCRRQAGAARPHRRGVDARPLDPHQPAQDRRPARRPRAARRGLVAPRPIKRRPASRRRLVAQARSSGFRRLDFVDLNQGEVAPEIATISCASTKEREERTMGYKEILVTVDTGPAGSARLDFAAALAERFEAHLIGLHTALTPLAPHRGGYFDHFDRSLLDPIYREFSDKNGRAGRDGAIAVRGGCREAAARRPSGALPPVIRPRPLRCTAVMPI